MTETFDLVVIGTGVAASTASYKCNDEGWNVAVVDSRPYGGTCPLRGCDPKKVLVGAADVVDWARRMKENGVHGDPGIDWPRLMAFKRSFTHSVPEDREKAFDEAGISTLHGRARFTGKNQLEVDGTAVEAKKFLIASGARPMPLGFTGEEHLTSSTGFLSLDHLPERVVFVGGGYISFEFAHIAARAGADVKILHRSKQLLKGFDPDLVEKLVAGSRDHGIDIRLNAAVEAIEPETDGTLLVHTQGDGDPVRCDLAVHGAGRIAEIEDLDLDAAGIAHDKKGVKVTEHLQNPTNPDVYAAGDSAASEGSPLTPVATAEAGVAASNLMKGNRSTVDYSGTPSVCFTIPAVARAGMLEAEAKEAGVDYEVNQGDMEEWYAYRRVASTPAAYKVLVEKDTDRIIGAHLLGERAEETINLFALAIRKGLTAHDLRTTIWAYPTHGSDVPSMV